MDYCWHLNLVENYLFQQKYSKTHYIACCIIEAAASSQKSVKAKSGGARSFTRTEAG
jgi:hypothetical protein